MQQGDIIMFGPKKYGVNQVGIAYDSRLIITGDWKGVRTIPLQTLVLSHKFMILIYRPDIFMNNHKRTHFKNALAALASKQVKLKFKEKIKFWRYIQKFYNTIAKINIFLNPNVSKVMDLDFSSNMKLVKKYSGYTHDGNTF